MSLAEGNKITGKPSFYIESQRCFVSRFPLTVCEISDVRRKRDQREVCGVDILVHICLSFHRLQEGKEPGGERSDEDRQHAKIQNVPELRDVFLRTLRPEFLTL